MRQKNLQLKELGQKMNKKIIRQVTSPKQDIIQNYSKSRTLTTRNCFINGLENIRNVLSFIKIAKINSDLQNSIINLLNSYALSLQTFIQSKSSPAVLKKQIQNNLSYLSVKIASKQKSQLNQIKIINQQISEHQNNTELLDSPSLFTQKQNQIKRISKQNLKLKSSKGFLPQINKKFITNNSQYFTSIIKQTNRQNKYINHDQKAKLSEVERLISANLQEQNKIEIKQDKKVHQQIINRVQNSQSQQKNEQLLSDKKMQIDLENKNQISKAKIQCNLVDSEEIIKKLRQEVSIYTAMIQELKTKLVELQERQINLKQKQQSEIKFKTQKDTSKKQSIKQTNFNQLKQKQQVFDGKNSEIIQKDQEITILKDYLQQKQLQLTNLWIIIQSNSRPFFESLN